MRNSSDKQNFTCKDNYGVEAMIGVLVFCVVVSISVFIGMIYGLCSKKLKYVPDGLCLLAFVSMFAIAIVMCVFTLCKNKPGIFSIDNSIVKLVGKRSGESICIERNIDDIKCIVIKTFGRSTAIILADLLGDIGNFASTTKNNEFIRISYSKRRLNAIKKYLPECPIEYS